MATFDGNEVPLTHRSVADFAESPHTTDYLAFEERQQTLTDFDLIRSGFAWLRWN